MRQVNFKWPSPEDLAVEYDRALEVAHHSFTAPGCLLAVGGLAGLAWRRQGSAVGMLILAFAVPTGLPTLCLPSACPLPPRASPRLCTRLYKGCRHHFTAAAAQPGASSTTSPRTKRATGSHRAGHWPSPSALAPPGSSSSRTSPGLPGWLGCCSASLWCSQVRPSPSSPTHDSLQQHATTAQLHSPLQRSSFPPRAPRPPQGSDRLNRRP